MVNGVGFRISIAEGFALGPETWLQSLRASYGKSFISGQRNTSDIDIRSRWSSGGALYTFSVGY